MNEILQTLCKYIPPHVKSTLLSLDEKKLASLNEIRLRLGRPCMLDVNGVAIFTKNITKDDIDIAVGKLSDYSLNSVMESLCNGYITLPHGIRVGVCSNGIVKDGQTVFVNGINGLCYRIPQRVTSSAEVIVPDMTINNRILNTLVISPPKMGKTTLLRDIARLLGDKTDVCIIDERNEIASCVDGMPSFDVGKRTDVISSIPKPEAIQMAIRSLSPAVIITDEIGKDEDALALLDASLCGVGFVASIHSESFEDASKRSCAELLIKKNVIKLAVVLCNTPHVGSVKSIIML
ncbi:MAG: hypothetical protein E7312_03520 [Clostridiales bacterium]|nr:hypothetical protein [Clostridiales bacterium]